VKVFNRQVKLSKTQFLYTTIEITLNIGSEKENLGAPPKIERSTWRGACEKTARLNMKNSIQVEKNDTQNKNQK
jgi:hypothetical protein